MRGEQRSFTDLEYGNRRRVSRRETFLESMDEVIPWEQRPPLASIHRWVW